MKHASSHRNRILLGACAVAAAMAFASQGLAHGASMGMGARGGMAMQPPNAGPHPFDPSGHLNGPVNPSPIAPRIQPAPLSPRLDPPGSDSMSGGADLRTHTRFNNPSPAGTDTSGQANLRTHAPFNNPNTTGGKLSGEANVSPSAAPVLDPPGPQ